VLCDRLSMGGFVPLFSLTMLTNCMVCWYVSSVRLASFTEKLDRWWMDR
jgi:hypothetical protein